MLFSFGSPGRLVEIFCFGDANGGPAFRGPDARPPRLLLALHGHIETFSKVPKRLYRLFDTPVSLGPFSSRCHRAAAFVTRMGNFCSNLAAPKRDFRPSGLDFFFVSRVCKGKGFEGFNLRVRGVLFPSRSCDCCFPFCRVCAPEFYLVGARMREAYVTRLGSVYLPGDARRTHVRRSRHLLFTTRRSRAVESPESRGTGYT
ncbi:hypothetical protein CRG98_005489 [Punica granatum]|uniref:Uncharacterized protein n=1 Tax=Punica granatum TaxID=22663 RepID=A0A2I0L0K7_PUNGR|nr:hypothetical protein CRG98_005489 [Punica granatum]